jgi:2-polyprenyl-6-methoxyphenol hydroxylase-like FAD-dependent oxidoreductase
MMAAMARPRGLNVGILGGSITGCAMAAELARAGCAVTVLEAGAGQLADRGAGIGLPPSLVRKLIDHGLVDADLPYLEVHRFPHVVHEGQERHGHPSWEQRGRVALLNWGVLHANLRRRVPDRAYETSRRVTAIREQPDGTVVVDLAHHGTREFDLLVCADGHRSLGRQTLFPQNPVRYAGYVLWRGALEESELPETTPLEGALCWPRYAGGYGPFFLVPGADGSTAPGRRLVNWGLYLRVSEVERAELVTGKAPPAYDDPLPAVREARLKSWVPLVLPEYYAEIVQKTPRTFAQKIHESEIPAYRVGHICLAGDAAALARPHTGTGVLKGITDAITLGETLTGQPPLDEALALWSDEQTAFGNALVKLGKQLGRALAAEPPQGEGTDAVARERLFSSMVTVPSEVFGA